MQLVDRKTCGWQQQCKLLGQRAGRQVAHEQHVRFGLRSSRASPGMQLARGEQTGAGGGLALELASSEDEAAGETFVALYDYERERGGSQVSFRAGQRMRSWINPSSVSPPKVSPALLLLRGSVALLLPPARCSEVGRL